MKKLFFLLLVIVFFLSSCSFVATDNTGTSITGSKTTYIAPIDKIQVINNFEVAITDTYFTTGGLTTDDAARFQRYYVMFNVKNIGNTGAYFYNTLIMKAVLIYNGKNEYVAKIFSGNNKACYDKIESLMVADGRFVFELPLEVVNSELSLVLNLQYNDLEHKIYDSISWKCR